MILLDSVISPPPLDSECWHQNSIIRIMMLSFLTICDPPETSICACVDM